MEINSLSLDSIKSLYYHLINTNEEYDTIIYNNRNNFIRLNEFITEIDDNVKNLQYLKCKTPNNEYLIKETLEKFMMCNKYQIDKQLKYISKFNNNLHYIKKIEYQYTLRVNVIKQYILKSHLLKELVIIPKICECNGEENCPILLKKLINGRFIKLSDGYCYSMEGINEMFKNDIKKSPITRVQFTKDDFNKMCFVHNLLAIQPLKVKHKTFKKLNIYSKNLG